MDKPGGVQKVPDGSGEQRKMEETGSEVICDAPTTLAVKGYMMMIMVRTTWETEMCITATRT